MVLRPPWLLPATPTRRQGQQADNQCVEPPKSEKKRNRHVKTCSVEASQTAVVWQPFKSHTRRTLKPCQTAIPPKSIARPQHPSNRDHSPSPPPLILKTSTVKPFSTTKKGRSHDHPFLKLQSVNTATPHTFQSARYSRVNQAASPPLVNSCFCGSQPALAPCQYAKFMR